MSSVENILDHYYFRSKSKHLSVFKTVSGVSIEIVDATTNKKETFEIDIKQMLLLIGLFNDVYCGENRTDKDFLNDHYKQLQKRLKNG